MPHLVISLTEFSLRTRRCWPLGPLTTPLLISMSMNARRLLGLDTPPNARLGFEE